MFWPVKIQKLNIPRQARVIAVSDVHGNLPFFTALMEKISLTPDDYLVLLGDMLEKGTQSLALLRHIMSLQQTHNIIYVCGNCDGLVLRFFNGDHWDEGFFKNYLRDHPECIIRQMADEIGFEHWTDLPALRVAVRTHFADIWNLLDNLPHIVETEDYLFVHGGLSSLEGMDKLNAWDVMKNDYFYDQGYSFPKYLVVGHCPVTLFHKEIPSAAPIIDHERKILSIDGGCVLKLDGQLNALMMQNGEVSYSAYDGQPVVVALENQSPSEHSLNLRWGHNEVEVLSAGEEFSLCKHHESGETLQILTRFLRQTEDGKTLAEDCTDYLLPVTAGDHLSLSEVVSDGILAKKDGVTGWYWGEWNVEN